MTEKPIRIYKLKADIDYWHALARIAKAARQADAPLPAKTEEG